MYNNTHTYLNKDTKQKNEFLKLERFKKQIITNELKQCYFFIIIEQNFRYIKIT